MMSAKAADPPNPGTFWAPDARTLIYKNGITAQQSSLDIEGNKDDGVGGINDHIMIPRNINGS